MYVGILKLYHPDKGEVFVLRGFGSKLNPPCWWGEHQQWVSCIDDAMSYHDYEGAESARSIAASTPVTF